MQIKINLFYMINIFLIAILNFKKWTVYFTNKTMTTMTLVKLADAMMKSILLTYIIM